MNTNKHSHYKFKNGKKALNRVVVPPMASQTANADGFATDKTIEHYARLSQSGAGIIFAEYSFIHRSGKGENFQLGADDNSQIEGLKKITEVIHASGALSGLQIVHVGSKRPANMPGGQAMAPSQIRVPIKGWEAALPREMNYQDIQNWRDWFLSAAHRASLAEFDIVELHAAHGYGLNQWLSPITNLRTDKYGGSVENRARLLIEIVQEIRAQLPELLVSVRIPGQDHMAAGLTISETSQIVKWLEQAGADLINVSSGIGGWRRPDGHAGEGYLVADATSIKNETSLPVIGVGGIESGETINRLLSNAKIDFAAVGRAILKGPAEWRCAQLL